MSWGIVAAAGASVIGGAISAKGSKDAAKSASNASSTANAQTQQQFEQSMLANILLNSPAINSGNVARSELSGMLGLSVPGTNYAQLAQGFDPNFNAQQLPQPQQTSPGVVTGQPAQSSPRARLYGGGMFS